ncbi:unnamed protein product [Pleuronectes platessa]|uniref:Uncharacterized protein n=1 Tax=Pleuronectes platessa TaxID=8262 RepID=A0A9N7Z2R2_PLEPL|nr:unnamed protein product [Pleuronectes platessa]
MIFWVEGRQTGQGLFPAAACSVTADPRWPKGPDSCNLHRCLHRIIPSSFFLKKQDSLQPPAVTHDSTGRVIRQTPNKAQTLSLTRRHIAHGLSSSAPCDKRSTVLGSAGGKKKQSNNNLLVEKDAQRDQRMLNVTKRVQQLMSRTGLAKKRQSVFKQEVQSHTINTCQRWRTAAQWCPNTYSS